MFDTVVTLEYGQGHWKWYDQVKVNEEQQYAKFDFNHIYGVWEDVSVEVFDKPRHLTDEYIPESHKSHCPWTFLMCVATQQHLNWSGQGISKIYK